MKWLIGSIISGLMTVVGLAASIEDSQNMGVSVVMLLLFILCFKKYRDSKNPDLIKLKEQKKNEKYNREKLIPGSKARQKLLGADLCIKAKHMAGLPFAEGTEVFVYRCPNKLVFERNQDTVELSIDKVRDIFIKTDVEIQKSYSSSVGGAVGGYVIFGPLGAMIGGRSKEKKSTIEEKYLIFAYMNKENEQDYISFEVTKEPNANLFNTNYYNLGNIERRKIEL
jgi:hypothetical protein